MTRTRVRLAAVCLFVCASSHALAQSVSGTCATTPSAAGLLDEVHTIADASRAVPVECSFDVSVAGSYQVTLADLGVVPDGSAVPTPAPLASVKLAVTSGGSLVGTVLSAPGSMRFSATVGTYVIHIVGLPGSAPGGAPGSLLGSGPIGIEVTNVSTSTQLASFSPGLALPASALPPNESVINDSFMVQTDGNYVVTLSDLALPQPLTTLTALVTTGATVVTTPPLPTAGSVTVSLQHGIPYRIFAVGQADATVNAGLYSATVTPVGGGAAAYSKIVPVGAVAQLDSVALNAGGSYTLSVADLSFPSALTSVGAVVASSGQVAAQLSTSGTSAAFAAAGGYYQVFALATTGTAGSYTVSLGQPGSAPALSVARAISAGGTTGPKPYSFDSSIATAGSYTLALADFSFPTAFTSIDAVAVQGGAILGTPLTAAGSQSITAASGPISFLAFAQPGSGGSLFDLSLSEGTAATPVFDATQGVGDLFSGRQVTITSAGTYAVTVGDVGFPAALSTFAVVVSRGTTQLGAIYGGGTFTFPATPGNYLVTFIAQPGGSDEAGTYSLNVRPAPVVSLTSDVATVATGGTVHLTWTSQNATTCTASGGWSGAQATGGTVVSAPLSAAATYTLTCTDAAGASVAQSVSVAVSDPPKSGGGGGLGIDELLALAVAVLARIAGKLSGSRLRRTALSGGLAIGSIVVCGLILSGCGGAQSRLASHMKHGQAFFAQGNFIKASVEFRNAMQIAPKDPAARIMAARTAESLGRPRDAAGLYQSVLDGAPDNLEARENLARLFVMGGAADRAMATVEPGLAKHPDSAGLLTYRAAAQLQLRKPAEALADVDRALKLSPTNEDAVTLRAGMYRDAGDLAAAQNIVSKAIQQEPASVPLREVLANLYMLSGDSDKAEEQLRALLRAKPSEVKYRYQLAAFYTRSHRIDAAQHELEEAVKTAPDSDDPKLTLIDFVNAQRGHAAGMQMLKGYIARQPDNLDLRLSLGALLQSAAGEKEARDVYNEIIRRDGTHAKGLIARDRLARIELAQAHADAALKLVGEVLHLSPRDDEALAIRAQVSLARGDPAATIGDLRAVLENRPRDVGVHRMLARAYVANGETGLAEQSLRTALDVAPTDTSVRVELAQLLLRTQRADMAAKLLEETVRSAPSDVQARDAIARAYLAKNDLAAARTASEDLKTLRPTSPDGFYLAGLVAEGQNRLDDAQHEFEQALQLQPLAIDPLSALTRLLVSRGRGPQAIEVVTKANEREPRNAVTLNLLGQLYMAQHDLPQALQALNEAIAAAPGWWVPYRNLALVKYSNKDPMGARAAYEAGIKAAPTEPQLPTELASLYIGSGSIDAAIALYESWHRNNPRVQSITNNLAMLLVTYKKDSASLDRARDLSASFASSTDGALLDTNGWVHFKRAEYSDALPVLQKAAEQAPNSREIYYHLGMTELRSGQTERARKDLETAVSGEAKYSGADDARSALAALKSRSG